MASGEDVVEFLPDAPDVLERMTRWGNPIPALLPSPLMRGAPEISMSPPTTGSRNRRRQIAVIRKRRNGRGQSPTSRQRTIVWWGSRSADQRRNSRIGQSSAVPEFDRAVQRRTRSCGMNIFTARTARLWSLHRANAASLGRSRNSESCLLAIRCDVLAQAWTDQHARKESRACRHWNSSKRWAICILRRTRVPRLCA